MNVVAGPAGIVGLGGRRSESSSCYQEACDLALRGTPVFPVNGKVPFTEHGFFDATTEIHRITEWWTKWPKAGIGGPTGN